MALFNKLFFTSATSSGSSTSPITLTTDSNWTPLTSSNSSQVHSATSIKNTKNQGNYQSMHSKNYLSQFPFNGGQIRILLYMECDSRGRRILFDSNALQKVSFKDCDDKVHKGEKDHKTSSDNYNNSSYFIKQSPLLLKPQSDKTHSYGFIEVTETYGYKHNRPNSADITSIGEMIFGASAMSFRGTAFKVHWLQEPVRILCSQVYLTPINATTNQLPFTNVPSQNYATPRTSISSEQIFFDNLPMSSYSTPFLMNNGGRHMSLTSSDRSTTMSCPLNVPDPRLFVINSDIIRPDSEHRYSSTYSTVTDSGYSGASRCQMASDLWPTFYQYSTRSSFGSETSELPDPLRKLSMDFTYYTNSQYSAVASDSSLQHRISRNLRTSFENEHSVNDLIGFISDSYPLYDASTNGGSEGNNMNVTNYRRASYSANESYSNPEITKPRDVQWKRKTMRRGKLGLAVCITMSESFEEEMELFCSEHISVLESMLSRLRLCTEQAYNNHKDLLLIMYHAWQDAQQWFCDLFTAPRIKCPIWLNITTSGSKYSKNIAERFMKELCWLLSFADTKDTNFFISTVLTAILTHHLGWVSTVSEFHRSTTLSHSAETTAAAIDLRAKLQQISQRHPYNPLWAQISDLYGAIGMPPKLGRTIVYGTEKLSVERLLNVLTYFIRCGEVRRSTKCNYFNKQIFDKIAKKGQSTEKNIKSSTINSFCLKPTKDAKKTTTTTTTPPAHGNLPRVRSINHFMSNSSTLDGKSEDSSDQIKFIGTLKKNEIPNVLAYRDSRFVQQELRIGNFLMDTGIEKKSLLQNQTTTTSTKATTTPTLCMAKNKTMDNFRIPMIIKTKDENVSLSGSANDDGAVEAIEIEPLLTEKRDFKDKKNFLWTIVPETVQDGFSIKPSVYGGNGCNIEKNVKHLSLSDLITQNSMGKSDRMTWGVEPIKENISLEEQIHFDYCQKLIEREHGICLNGDNIETDDKTTDNGVIFMLGDNEPLVNIKRSIENLCTDDNNKHKFRINNESNCQQLCPSHRRMQESVHKKKHSGVKFNFEQYPQIATNYMKNKNLVMTDDYDFMINNDTNKEKIEKSKSSMNFTNYHRNNEHIKTNSFECIICNKSLKSYQTPSNATELEYEVDENYLIGCSENSEKSLLHQHQQDNFTESVETLKSFSGIKSNVKNIQNNENYTTTHNAPSAFCSNIKNAIPRCGSVSSIATKCDESNETLMMHLQKLPIPAFKQLSQNDERSTDMKLHAGFIPSLFMNVNDHYVSDMVLQGTNALPKEWVTNLREDLNLATRSASLISLPTENIAIVADMEKWDVQIITSQSQYFPLKSLENSPVGMSQLVSSMLETVQVMSSSGIPPYECLSYLELKLKEIYLQSETLAAFLLATDFCQLSEVTKALNLSDNDVPLLLSIASIHTPQISKKCGISFR